MAKYTCEICAKGFAQKGHYENHRARANPCKPAPSAAPPPSTEPSKKDLGQYFTISEELQQFVFDHVQHKMQRLLEPSFGAGHLLKKFMEYDPEYPITCYELDARIKPVVSFRAAQTPIYGDFTQQILTQRFKTIVGNPPYVKQAQGNNLYLQFIKLCYEALDDDGELLMIVPSDFLKLTSASAIITEMKAHGSFTHFLFPHNEKLFEGASIDVVVFRYEKGLQTPKALVNTKEMFCNVNQGIITFSESEVQGVPIQDRMNVYVGLVSGRDEIYRVPFGNIELLCDKGRCETFLFPETFPTQSPQMNAHLTAHKEELLSRKIRKFSEANWYEWGAPRNLAHIRANWGKPCIYVRTMTRNQEVAFLGQVQYFGGSLLCLIPKAEMTQEELAAILAHLNSPLFQKDYIYAGRFKMGHKQISSAILPS